MNMDSLTRKIEVIRAVDPSLLRVPDGANAENIGRMLMASEGVLNRLVYLKEAGRAQKTPSAAQRARPCRVLLLHATETRRGVRGASLFRT